MDDIDILIDSAIGQRKTVDYLNGHYANVVDIKPSLSKGDGVFALKAFSIRDKICSLPFPLVHAIDSHSISTVCYGCLVATNRSPTSATSSTSLKTCSGCQFAHFCNRECQVRAWSSYHKCECRILKKCRLPALARAVMRIVLLRGNGMFPEAEWLRIQSFVAHERAYWARGRSNLTEMAESIQLLTVSKLSAREIEKLLFIMRSNAVEIPGNVNVGIGIMLDPLVAKMNHSCEPNIALYRVGDFVSMVPLRDIEEGEELFNCYVLPTMGVEQRRLMLREQYLIDCECELCRIDGEMDYGARYDRLTRMTAFVGEIWKQSQRR